jgi:hypothetical protein
LGLITLIAALIIITILAVLITTLLIPGILITAKVKPVVQANIVPADLPGVFALTMAIVMPLVGEVSLEVVPDGPVTHIPLKKWVLVLNLQNTSQFARIRKKKARYHIRDMCNLIHILLCPIDFSLEACDRR